MQLVDHFLQLACGEAFDGELHCLAGAGHEELKFSGLMVIGGLGGVRKVEVSDAGCLAFGAVG